MGEELLKKRITYTDFNGEMTTEEFYFHLSKAELIEMEMSHKGGLHEYLQRIVASEDGKAIIEEFKDLILAAYGKRSEDGKRFIKNQDLRDEFASSEAYSQLFFELCTDAEKAAEFITGIVPPGLGDELANLNVSTENGPDPSVTTVTVAELQAMDPAEVEEVQKGLMTGHYKLAP
jgi:hypothetical protein